MAISSDTGPLLIGTPGNSAASANPIFFIPDNNPDLGPSAFQVGFGVLDARMGILNGSQAATAQAAVLWSNTDLLGVFQAPSTAAAANIAAAANPTSGTPLALVSSSGSGVTVLASAVLIPPTGITVAAGSLALDTAPVVLTYGQNGSVVTMDPRNQLARCVSVTGVSGGSGGTILVSGADVWGAPMSQLITLASGVNTVNSTKAFKFIYSATPQFTDTHAISVGTADIFGFPFRVDDWTQCSVYWNNAAITASTGFVAAVTTTATTTTGDVRGTYAVQSASDGTKKLSLSVNVPPWNAATNAGVYGVTQA